MGEKEKKPPASAADGPPNNKRGNRKKRYGNKPTVQAVNFQGGKEELGGNYFYCKGCGQSDRFMKTVQKIADHIGQECKGGGITCTKVMTQTAVIIPTPSRAVSICNICRWSDCHYHPTRHP
jgi:hypothetical protein